MNGSTAVDARTVVVLGGYGNFGKRIVAALAHDAGRVLVAGRNAERAEEVARRIGGNSEAWQVDCHAKDFPARLRAEKAFAVVHAAGPFQGQDYQVAQACVAANCHYVDIADGRAYVANINQLDHDARTANVLVTSGASSLPALTSAVVDRLATQFARIDTIEHAVSSGAKPPGLATMRGVLSYVGKPLQRWQDGAWKTVFGWQDAVAYRFPKPIGKRWLATCDVPDLDLFTQRYSPTQSVIFRAGVGFTSTTLTLWALSWLVRAGLVKNLSRASTFLHRIAEIVEPLGSKWSALVVQVRGVDQAQQPLRKSWILLAGNNHGPNIPCFPAIALTRKLLRDQIAERGAMSCVGLLTVDDILGVTPTLNVRVVEGD